MTTRLQGSVAILTPDDGGGTSQGIETLEQELWYQSRADRSVVIDGTSWRQIDMATLAVLIAAKAMFEQAGRQLAIACVDKYFSGQLEPFFESVATVELAMATIERSSAPAVSQ